ncbi:PTS sugar transporter subunit IIB [Eubacterium callanderi]|uniref:PTS sugar transporter subunit IIB n=1 Tax=Eubacterium callanderi TaxID=53442 RepID=UPI001C2DEEF9|nr:PTS sugar transporter subunit IIB [Eubacterium callanderi]MBV1684088.1 PTS sugar transporter subunit IIB [Eubacterium callanderi]WPK69242.1 hypothetical protein EUCA2A_34300 [Eubacterium callanderi]WPK73540.1 hypothetical protein EUCA11A_34300 [Eubacterium callanderi]
MSKVNVVTVCGFGIGSSLILKMTLDSVLQKAGLSDQVEAEPHDVTSAASVGADLILVSNELKPQIENLVTCPLLVIDEFLNEGEVEEKALPIIRELLEAK